MEDIKVIREEFKKYLYKQVADNKLSKVDADTQYSDADYPRKHADELGINYWESFRDDISLENLLSILKERFTKEGKNPSTIVSYKRALKNFKIFIDENGDKYAINNHAEINYYWVCQSQNYKNEKNEKSLIAPDTKSPHRQILKELKVCDKIISYNKNKGIQAILDVTKAYYIDDKNNIIVNVNYNELSQPIVKVDFVNNIKKHNINVFYKNSPIDKNYNINTGYCFKISKEFYNATLNQDAYLNNYKKSEVNMDKFPKNLILYGPPGTGKTYNTIVKAMEIIGSNSVSMKDEKGNFKNNYSFDEYKKLKEEFDNYKNDDRIEFITFHQSYSYEEFVEGIKPDLDAESWNEPVDKLTYKGSNGIFKTAANRALFERLNIQIGQQDAILDFKKLKDLFIEEYSIGSTFKTGTKNAEFRIDKYTKDSARITPTNGKYTYSITFKYLEEAYNRKMASQNEIATIKGVASGLSCYYFAIYEKMLKIKKLNDHIQVKSNMNEMSDEDKLQLVRDYYEGKIELNNNKTSKPHVLIIDEINRGNVSKIFGELITLIEEDKRENMSVKLPYSQETFTVPKNLYIIGTMNTSDRSIASIDIALRRRFKFVEMMPKKELVADFGINFAGVFEYLNTKIKILLDRDHQIGHSYFIKTKYENAGIDELKTIWFSEILPLLNEYFYCDWEKLKLIVPGFIKPLEVPPALKSECDNSIYEFKTYDEISDFEKALKQEKFEQV